MKTLAYPTGSIVELIDHDSPHCGVVFDSKTVLELVAFKDEDQQKMICRIIPINLETTLKHPVNGKLPRYKLRERIELLTTEQVKERVKTLKPKYDGNEYHIIYNNCQHFAYEVSTGIRRSPDADKFKAIGGLIGNLYQIKDFGIGDHSSASSGSSTADICFYQQELNRLLRFS